MKKIFAPMLVGLSCVTIALPALAHQASDKGHQDMPKEQKEWGIGGDAKAVTRTIEITMLDTMRFVPEQITVKQGETIRLTVKNVGKVMHELVIGTKQELDMHAEMMKSIPIWNMTSPIWHTSLQEKKPRSSGTSIALASLILPACFQGTMRPAWLARLMWLRELNDAD